MEKQEVMKRYVLYNRLVREMKSGCDKQIAIHTMALAILDGDINRLKEYSDLVQKTYPSSSIQNSIDTLTMCLMEKTNNNGTLISSILSSLK